MLKTLLASEVYGKVQSIEANFNSVSDYDSTSYLFDKHQGGALYDVGSYSIGFICDLLENRPKVIAVESRFEYGVDMYFKAHLENNGRSIWIEGAKDRSAPRRAIITTSLAEIEVEMYNRPFSFTVNGRKVSLPNEHNDMIYEIEAFHEAYNKGWIEHPLMSHQHSLDVMEIMESIKESYEN